MENELLYQNCHALGALLNVLLHDVKNPLHSMTLLLEAMNSKVADQEQLRNRLRVQLQKLNTLTTEVGSEIRAIVVSAQPVPIAVAELLDAVQKQMHEDRKLEMHSAAEPLPRVQADPPLLVRALTSLCAYTAPLQAEGDKAVLPLEGSAVPSTAQGPRVVRIESRIEKDSVHMVICHAGQSLPESVRKGPFNLMSGGRELSLARALVQSMGGSVRLVIDSVEPKFEVILPLAGSAGAA